MKQFLKLLLVNCLFICAGLAVCHAQSASVLLNVLENSIAVQGEMDGDTTVSGLQVLPKDILTAISNYGKTASVLGSPAASNAGNLMFGLEAFAGIPELNLFGGVSDCGLFISTGCVYVSPGSGNMTAWTAGPANISLSPTGGVTAGDALWCGESIVSQAEICTGSAVGTEEAIDSDWCAGDFSAYTTCFSNPYTNAGNAVPNPDISVSYTINGTTQTTTYDVSIADVGNATNSCPTGYGYYMPLPSINAPCQGSTKPIKISLSTNTLPPSYSPAAWTEAERNAAAAGTDGGLSLSGLTRSDLQKMSSGLWLTAAAESGYAGPPLNGGELPVSAGAVDIALSGAMSSGGAAPTAADADAGVGTISNAGTGSQTGAANIAIPETLIGAGAVTATGALISPDAAYSQVGGVAAADAAALLAAGITVGQGTTTGTGSGSSDAAATPQNYFCGADGEQACTLNWENSDTVTDTSGSLPVPTPDSMFSQFFNLVPGISNWTPPGHTDTCPEPEVELFGTYYQATEGCDQLQSNASAVASGVDVAWVLAALFIVLGA